ncbi:MAG: hypothetical protein ACLP7P_00455 [Rhodomicrobium sp.]
MASAAPAAMTPIYRKIGSLRAVQLLPGHFKVESTMRYSGIEGSQELLRHHA